MLNQPNGPAQLDASGSAGSFGVLGRSLAARAQDRLNILDAPYQASNTAVSINPAVTTSGTALTLNQSVFTPASVGLSIFVSGAGASGGTLSTTIAAYVSPTQVTLASAAGTALTASAQTVLFGADSSAAFTAAITAANAAMAAHKYACIYLPAGNYIVNAATAAFAQGMPGCVVGDGAQKAVIYLGPGFSGDLFAWSEAWILYTSGPLAAGFRIYGWPTAAQQNALMFYDRNDNALLQDVDVWNLPGRAIYSGVTKNAAQAYMRESRFERVRLFNDGAAGVPVVEFNSQGTTSGQDATNEIDVNAMDIYSPNGPGFVVRNNSVGTIRAIRSNQLRVEGKENNPNSVAADLVTIGDATMAGAINSLNFRQLELFDAYSGYAAFRVQAANATQGINTYSIDVQGIIGGGAMGSGVLGLVVNAGRNSRFDFTDINTTGTNVTVGPTSGGTGTQLEISGPGGRENSWTWNVDSSALQNVLSPPLRTGNPGSPTTIGFTLGLHDSSAAGGSPIGSGAVDLQSLRNQNYQVASGAQAVLLGGSYNSATASSGAVIAGTANQSYGVYGFIAGSAQASDRGRWGGWAYSSGSNGPVAAFQAGRQGLAASGTAAMRLTAGFQAANSAFAPIFNAPTYSAMTLSIRLSAVDKTAPANSYAWYLPIALMTRQSTAASTALAVGTPVALWTGTGSSASVSATADTTNAGLNLTFTPPTGTDTWDVFADVWSTENQ